MSLPDAVKSCLQKYVVWQGRASRLHDGEHPLGGRSMRAFCIERLPAEYSGDDECESEKNAHCWLGLFGGRTFGLAGF